MINPQIDYINDDSLYVISCNHCAKKNTEACNTCSRKRTESKPKKECHQCSEKPKKCGCEDKKDNCTVKRSVCNSEYFAVQNYFSELVHDWEKDLAKYNLGISELESINYFTDQTENGELLNKVQFVFRRGHEVITKEFLVAPKGEKGDKGEPFEWKDLTNEQKEQLRGKTGYTPILKDVYITYSESLCDVSGHFVNQDGTLYYDLYLTLPKQKSFQECLDEIQSMLDQYTTNINTQLNTINSRINDIKEFDFNKLGLRLLGNNEITFTYDNLISGNSVTLNIPEQHQYSLKVFSDVNDYWKNYVALLKDGIIEGDIYSAEPYKPKDWWILPYPSVILMSNGNLITKKLRISAWFSQPEHPAVDKTAEYSQTDSKDYIFYLQTTSSYVDKVVNGEHVWENSWSDIGYRYDAKTGMLTLPENETIEYNPSENKTYKHKYMPGGFISAVLYATDSRPRRLYIPVIDVDNVYGLTDAQQDTQTFTDWDPNDIPEDITSCTLVYTKDFVCDLSNFYDSDDNLIDSIVTIHAGSALYQVKNNKKYFKGNFTKESSSVVPSSEVVYFSKFKFGNISISSDYNAFNVSITYDNQQATYKQMSALYNFLKDDSNFKDIIRLENKQDASIFDKYYLYSFDTNYLVFKAVSTDTPLFDHLYGLQVEEDIQYYKILLKHGGYNDINGELKVVWRNNQYQVVDVSETPMYYFNIWFNATYNQVQQNVYQQTNSVQPNPGTVLANNMFFNKGLFIAECELTGNPTISDTGEYAYTHSDDSIQVQNLTNKEIVISVDDKTFTIAPNATIIEELEPGEPVNH